MTDIEIANQITPQDINSIAKKLGLKSQEIVKLGEKKAKIITNTKQNIGNKLILVTAISPTSAGIGKTTVSIGLADALNQLGESVCLALREPSLGPVFGIKGGATGGGYSQIIPMEDINLHFNGDFHAITSANNLLCSMIDNHIYFGNELNIDTNKILFNRCLDLNDRALREIKIIQNNTERTEKFVITAASEIMAIMCLAKDIEDLKNRLERILVAFDKDEKPIYCKDLNCADAMAILLKDALKPNLVQTLEGTPAIVHLGPFANIAHGCNSIIATKTSMSLAKYTITEAGFGSDLGAEKFLDIKCRQAELNPDAIVLVTTVKALKLHGGASKECLDSEDLNAIENGFCNLVRHAEVLKDVYKRNIIVAINKQSSDTDEEIKKVEELLNWIHIPYAITTSWSDGGKGAITLANMVKDLCNSGKTDLQYAYELEDSIEDKLMKISQRVYCANGIIISKEARKKINEINKLGLSRLPIVIAKTQYSFSDNPELIGAPKDFDIHITDIEIKSGAGFIVAIAGNMMLMPGLSKSPAATKMTIDNNEKINGLF